MLHLFGICGTCLLLLECEGNRTPIICSFIVHFVGLAFVKLFIEVEAICAKQLALSSVCPLCALERELPKKKKKKKRNLEGRTTKRRVRNACIFMAFGYLFAKSKQ